MNPQLRYQLFTAVFYGICSGSMNFLNKNVLTNWNFQYPRFLMLFQMIFIAIGIDILKLFGVLRAHNYTLSLGMSCWQVSLYFAINTTIALFALTGMNIPMYNALRRCTPIMSLILGKFLLRNQKSTPGIWGSVLIITVGTFIAASGDLNFDQNSYLYGITSVVTQALYLITLQKTGVEKNIGAISIVYINSINCMPIMMILCFLTGDISAIAKYPNWDQPGFLFSFFGLVIAGCIFTYSMFLCTTTNSALTTALVSTAKSAITTIIGMFTFGGVTPTLFFIIGQTMNFIGGCTYSYIKWKSRNQSKNLLKQSHGADSGSVANRHSGSKPHTSFNKEGVPTSNNINETAVVIDPLVKNS